MKKIILYSALILFPAITFADKQMDGNRQGPVSEYVKQHIMPVVMEKRRAFDASLSATEQNELTSIREQLQQLRENHKAAMAERSEEMYDNTVVDNNATIPHEKSEAWSENHAKMKELMEQVHNIADNHRDQLDVVFNILAPQKEQWKSDIANLVADRKNEEVESASSSAGNNYAHYGRYGRFNKLWSRSGFLLLDASSASLADERQTDPGVIASSVETMSIYPNPATTEFTINLTNIPAENKLTIMDMTGKIIIEKENVSTSDLPTISCSDLSNGIYLVRLATPDQTINEKLIISH